MTFRVNFFPSKVPELVKHSLVFFLAGLHFASEKQSGTRVFQPKNHTGECSSTKLKSTCKDSGSFEGKEINPKKSLMSLLHQAIQVINGRLMTKLDPYILLPKSSVTLARACSVLRCIFHRRPDG